MQSKKNLISTFFWDDYRNTTMGRYLSQCERVFVKAYLDDAAQPRQVLDIACGSGAISLPLHDSGHNLVGLDIDPLPLAVFRQKSNGVPLTRSDSQRLPFVNDSFDCVVAFQCLQYFDHYLFLQECHRVLREGGLLIFQALNRRNYKRGLKRLFGCVKNLKPSYKLSCYEVLNTTVSMGFNIQAVSGYNWVPFDRYSNSVLVSPSALVEKMFRLDRLYNFSPWLLIAARKRSSF